MDWKHSAEWMVSVLNMGVWKISLGDNKAGEWLFHREEVLFGIYQMSMGYRQVSEIQFYWVIIHRMTIEMIASYLNRLCFSSLNITLKTSKWWFFKKVFRDRIALKHLCP